MTRKFNPAQGLITCAFLKALAPKFLRILFALCFIFVLDARPALVIAAPAPVGVEMLTNQTLTIVLAREMASGASVTVDLNPEYVANYPSCGFGASLVSNNTKILVTLPDGSCVPSTNLECAVITAVRWDGTVAATYSVAMVDGSWEVTSGEL